jgi:hypothetical protein
MIQENLKVIAELQDNLSPELKRLKADLDEFAKGVREGAKAELDAFKQTKSHLDGAAQSAGNLGKSFGGIGGNLKGVVGDLNAIASGSGDAADKAQGLVSALSNAGLAVAKLIGGGLMGLFGTMKTSAAQAEQAVVQTTSTTTASATQIAAAAGTAAVGYKGLSVAQAAAAKAAEEAAKASTEAALDVVAAQAKVQAAYAASAAAQAAYDAKKAASGISRAPAGSPLAIERAAERSAGRLLVSGARAELGAAEDALGVAKAAQAAKEADVAFAAFRATATTGLGFVAAAGLAASAAITAIALSARDAADKNAELAEKLGITTERLEALKVVAGENGGSVEGLVRIYDKYSKSVNKLDEDNAKSKFAFESLGTSLEEVQKLSKEEGAALLVRNFQDLGESTKATAAIAQLLGPSFRDQIPAIKAAATEMANATELVRKYGAEATPELVKAGGEQERALTEIKLAWQGFGNEVATSTGTFVKDALEGLAKLLNGIREFIKELRGAEANMAATEAIPQARRNELLNQAKNEVFNGSNPNATYGDVNKRYLELLETEKKIGDQTQMNNKFRQTEIADLNATAEAARKADLAKKSAAAKLPEKAGAKDPFEQAREQLERQLATTKDTTQEEKTLWETQQGRFKDFSAAQKKILIDISRQVDLRNNQLALDEKIKKIMEEEAKKETERANAVKKQQEAEADRLTLLEYELTLAGKTADEREKLVALKKDEIRLEKELRGLNPLDAADIKASDAELARRREALRGAANEAKTINEIVDNSKAAIQASVTSNLAAAKKLMDQNKISSDEYLSYQQEQFARLKKFQNEYERTWADIATGTQDILQTYLFDALQGQFDNLGDMFKKLIDRMVAQALAAKLAQALFGGAGTTGGGWVGAGASFLSGLFKAEGGDVNAGQPYIVGEKRPELFVPRTAGTIVPNIDGLKNPGTNISYQIYAMDSQDVARTLEKSARQVAQIVHGASARYNLRGA